MRRDCERIIETYELSWHGIAVTVEFEGHVFGDVDSDYRTSHLQIRSGGERALPITSTGYRSHFLPPDEIDAHGGPVSYVTRWLDAAGKSREWREAEHRQQQLSLF